MNRVLIGLSLGAAAAVGAVGIGLGYSGTLTLSRQADATVTAGSLTYYLCPNHGAAGELHHGDRVYVTGVDETGEWVQVRAPHHLDDRAWIQRPYLDPDEELDVPVTTCSTEVGQLELAEGPDGATTTTEPDDDPEEVEEPGDDPDEPTTTTTPGTPTTVTPTTTPNQPTPTTVPTPTTAPSPTTVPTQTTIPAPTISSVSVSPSTMTRRYMPHPGSCGSDSEPETAVLTATGVANASSATWVARAQGNQIGAGSLSGSGSTRTGAIGPFAWSDNSDSDVLVSVIVTVSGPGGSTQGSTSFMLLNCNIPF